MFGSYNKNDDKLFQPRKLTSENCGLSEEEDAGDLDFPPLHDHHFEGGAQRIKSWGQNGDQMG